jgi:RimJ/RimL family protein N-acetyltransferase
VNIVGERVALGPLRRDLLPLYGRWINDFAVARNMGVPGPVTEPQEAAWFDRVATSRDDHAFTIYELPSWRPVGTTGLNQIDLHHRTGEFGIMIGEAEARGRGIGTETARLVLDYAFTALGLHSVMLRVFEYNRAGLRAYEKAGYRPIGRRRESHMMGGKLWDTVYMECLASEFESPVLRGAFGLSPDAERPDGR